MTRFRPPSPQSSSSSPPLIPIEESPTLIPGFPNDIAALILSFLPFSHLLCVFPQDPSVIAPYLFDPRTLAWCPLPPMPCNPHVYGLCNFTSFSIGPHLHVIGAPSSTLVRFRSTTPLRPPPSSGSTSALPRGTSSPRCSHRAEVSPALRFQNRERFSSPTADPGTLCSARLEAEQACWSGTILGEMNGLQWMGCQFLRSGAHSSLLATARRGSSRLWEGYSESRTIPGVFPVDEHYRDAVVMELKNGNGGCRWREVGDMWETGERMRLGKIVVVEDGDDCGGPAVFMLDQNVIFRSDMASNRWCKESRIPGQAPCNSAFRFVVLDGELHVITLLKAVEPAEIRRSRLHTRAGTLYVQIYHPKKTWRSIIPKSPFHYCLDFNTAVMSTICL